MVNLFKGPSNKFILDQQFNLSYHMNMTWQDTQSMIPYEREILFHRLQEQFEHEKKMAEQAEGK